MKLPRLARRRAAAASARLGARVLEGVVQLLDLRPAAGPGRRASPPRSSQRSSCCPMWARSHTSGLISGLCWRVSSSVVEVGQRAGCGRARPPGRGRPSQRSACASSSSTASGPRPLDAARAARRRACARDATSSANASTSAAAPADAASSGDLDAAGAPRAQRRVAQAVRARPSPSVRRTGSHSVGGRDRRRPGRRAGSRSSAARAGHHRSGSASRQRISR